MAAPPSQPELDPNATALPEEVTTEGPVAAASALDVLVCPPSPTSTISGYHKTNDSNMTDDDVGFAVLTERRTKRRRN